MMCPWCKRCVVSPQDGKTLEHELEVVENMLRTHRAGSDVILEHARCKRVWLV